MFLRVTTHLKIKLHFALQENVMLNNIFTVTKVIIYHYTIFFPLNFCFIEQPFYLDLSLSNSLSSVMCDIQLPTRIDHRNSDFCCRWSRKRAGRTRTNYTASVWQQSVLKVGYYCLKGTAHSKNENFYYIARSKKLNALLVQ